jgi:hypothetical protein
VTFDFTSPAASVPQLPQPGTVPGRPCFLERAEPSTTAQAEPTTECGALGKSHLVRDWLNHPRFKQLEKP